MKIGVTQLVLPGMSLAEGLDLCNEVEYDAIELMFSAGGALDYEMSDDEIRAARKKCDDAGIEISSSLAWGRERGSLLSADPTVRESGRTTLLRSIHIAHVLGIEAILLNPGGLGVEGSYVQAWDGMLGVMREVAPIAEENGVVVGIENVWNMFLLSPREMAEFVDAVGSDYVAAYLDTANMMLFGYPEHWIRDLGSRIKRVHFKDFKRADRTFPPLMDGDTDWPTIMRLLREIDYDSYLIHEIGPPPGTSKAKARELQIEMAQRMKQIVAM